MSGIEAIERVLEVYRPADAAETVDVERMRALLHDRDDVRLRSELVHVTASALVVHPATREVLLRWHPRMAMWMQVGGHFDADESDPFVVAVREAIEETGLTDLRAFEGSGASEPVQIVIVPVPAH